MKHKTKKCFCDVIFISIGTSFTGI